MKEILDKQSISTSSEMPPTADDVHGALAIQTKFLEGHGWFYRGSCSAGCRGEESEERSITIALFPRPIPMRLPVSSPLTGAKSICGCILLLGSFKRRQISPTVILSRSAPSVATWLKPASSVASSTAARESIPTFFLERYISVDGVAAVSRSRRRSRISTSVGDARPESADKDVSELVESGGVDSSQEAVGRYGTGGWAAERSAVSLTDPSARSNRQ
ncbi:hypothetical protein LTR65_002339 [Meristemomyces frigidus]